MPGLLEVCTKVLDESTKADCLGSVYQGNMGGISKSLITNLFTVKISNVKTKTTGIGS